MQRKQTFLKARQMPKRGSMHATKADFSRSQAAYLIDKLTSPGEKEKQSLSTPLNTRSSPPPPPRITPPPPPPHSLSHNTCTAICPHSRSPKQDRVLPGIRSRPAETWVCFEEKHWERARSNFSASLRSSSISFSSCSVLGKNCSSPLKEFLLFYVCF